MRIPWLACVTLFLAPALVADDALAEQSGSSLANDQNLRAMIANPEDLDRARRSTATGRGYPAGKAVQSLIDGTSKALSDPRSSGSPGTKGSAHEP